MASPFGAKIKNSNLRLKSAGEPSQRASQQRHFPTGGDDARNFEPRNGFTFGYLDKIIPKLRAMHKEHPEWFEVPKPRSDKGRNAVDYSIN